MAAEELIVQTAQRRNRPAEPLDMHIGQVLLRAGKLTESDIKRIVSLQSGREIRFGDAALSLGMVERCDIQQALSSAVRVSVPARGRLCTELRRW